MASWHYGFVKDKRNGIVSVREIYVDNKGNKSYTLNPVEMFSENLKDLEWQIKAIRNDYRRGKFYEITEDGMLVEYDEKEISKTKPNSESS